MRRLPFLAFALLLPACQREPSFEERYEEQAGQIDSMAVSIEHELGQQINASVAAGRLRTDPNAPPSLLNRGME